MMSSVKALQLNSHLERVQFQIFFLKEIIEKGYSMIVHIIVAQKVGNGPYGRSRVKEFHRLRTTGLDYRLVVAI